MSCSRVSVLWIIQLDVWLRGSSCGCEHQHMRLSECFQEDPASCLAPRRIMWVWTPAYEAVYCSRPDSCLVEQAMKTHAQSSSSFTNIKCVLVLTLLFRQSFYSLIYSYHLLPQAPWRKQSHLHISSSADQIFSLVYLWWWAIYTGEIPAESYKIQFGKDSVDDRGRIVL